MPKSVIFVLLQYCARHQYIHTYTTYIHTFRSTYSIEHIGGQHFIHGFHAFRFRLGGDYIFLAPFTCDYRYSAACDSLIENLRSNYCNASTFENNYCTVHSPLLRDILLPPLLLQLLSPLGII